MSTLTRTKEDMDRFPESKTELIDCNGNQHRILVETDPTYKNVPRITLLDHSEEEIDGETVMLKLDGAACECVKFLDGWRNYYKFELRSNDGMRWEAEFEVLDEA